MPEPYDRRARVGSDELDALFTQIGTALPRTVTAWDIGGSPMVYRGLKAGTKDADLVVETPKERDTLVAVLTSDVVGYEVEGFLPEYKGLEGKLLRKQGALGVDVFVHGIMEGFRLSSTMKARADGPYEFGKLRLYHCANEDIFLLKAITHRPDDDQDLLLLLLAGLDEAIMRTEAKHQQELSGANWPWIIFRALEAAEERTGTSIPIKSRLV